MGWGNVKEAALACGVPVESWRNWERDGRLPRDIIGVCRAIAAKTGADPTWLAGLANDGGPGQEDRGRAIGGGSTFVMDDDGSRDWTRTSNLPVNAPRRADQEFYPPEVEPESLPDAA